MQAAVSHNARHPSLAPAADAAAGASCCAAPSRKRLLLELCARIGYTPQR